MLWVQILKKQSDVLCNWPNSEIVTNGIDRDFNSSPHSLGKFSSIALGFIIIIIISNSPSSSKNYPNATACWKKSDQFQSSVKKTSNPARLGFFAAFKKIQYLFLRNKKYNGLSVWITSQKESNKTQKSQNIKLIVVFITSKEIEAMMSGIFRNSKHFHLMLIAM